MTTISLPSDDARAAFGEPPDGVEVVIWDGTGTRPDAADRIEFFTAAYSAPPPPADTLAALPALRVIQLSSAGVEPWLSIVPDGVQLCNGRGVHGGSTAELAVAGLLAVVRDLPVFLDQQRARQWRRHDSDGLDGTGVLVLGAGDIGARVATALGAFGAHVTLIARHARDGVRTLDDVPQLLPDQHVVVVALPNTPQTTGLVDARFLAALPDGAIVVNIARGAIVDTDALLAELTTRRLRAFLDVTEPEPLPADHPLWDAPNLLLTPHVGGGTRGWEQRAYGLVREQVGRYVSGEQLANRVTDGY